MNRRLVMIAAGVVLAVVGFGTWWYVTDVRVEQKNESVQPQISEPVTEGGPTADTETPHPVSIPALFDKEFNGSELTLGRVLEQHISYTRYYVTYKSGDLIISGIMNIPSTVPPVGGFPVLVLNHGHIDTSIYTNGRGLRREQDYFARNGYTVLHPDYRNHAQSGKDDRDTLAVRLGYVEDVINAVYAIKRSDISNLNKDRIGMLGHSMGGGITLTAITAQPQLVQAAVLYAPVSGDMRKSYERWIERNSADVRQITENYGTPQSNPEFWDNISAETFYSRVAAPVQIFHGTNDSSVPLVWSEATRDLLKALGKSVELTIYPGAPHEFASDFTSFTSSANQFFSQYLKS